jgi:hypothetical protein
MSHPAFSSVLVASSDLGDDLAQAFGVFTIAAIVGGILGSRLEDNVRRYGDAGSRWRHPYF